jgi:hypothetical protein
MLSPSKNRLVLDPVKIAIARLSDDEIVSMDATDLLDVLRMADGLRSIRYLPRVIQRAVDDVLVEMVLAARDRCRANLSRTGQRAPTQSAA